MADDLLDQHPRCLVLGVRVLPESMAPARARLDIAGAVLSAAAVVLILLPLV
ncbi:hypothetical protein [Nocardia sp. NBC_01329]|uniref:hypothetical protein n=1 Tax=Nocardia sp. NBC_01329 TaxID=2903594 RepID=UPI002E10149F|nr:hypothetical protein OG405_14080 [Nocardia sp. NBC_01329]